MAKAVHILLMYCNKKYASITRPTPQTLRSSWGFFAAVTQFWNTVRNIATGRVFSITVMLHVREKVKEIHRYTWLAQCKRITIFITRNSRPHKYKSHIHTMLECALSLDATLFDTLKDVLNSHSWKQNVTYFLYWGWMLISKAPRIFFYWAICRWICFTEAGVQTLPWPILVAFNDMQGIWWLYSWKPNPQSQYSIFHNHIT